MPDLRTFVKQRLEIYYLNQPTFFERKLNNQILELQNGPKPLERNTPQLTEHHSQNKSN